MTTDLAVVEGESLSVLLRRRRLELGMTQAQVAGLVGCHTHHVCQHEQQKYIPLESTLLGYSVALDLEYGLLVDLREVAIRESFYGKILADARTRDIEHGTAKGYAAHYSRGEKPCPSCRVAAAVDQSDQRRKAGAAERRPSCGTLTGYRRHLRWEEDPCGPCADAFQQARQKRANSKIDSMPCGTNSKYRLHLLYGDDPCDACIEAGRKETRLRFTVAGYSSLRPAECGTEKGYRSHKYRKEPVCQACREAIRPANARYRVASKARASVA